jgi:glycosyltransferase involved in cell wall biosynthesis
VGVTVTISLIVSTYNRPDYLSIVLEAVGSQDDQGFELVIADDGSTTETKELIEKFKSSHSIDVLHIWHEDDGFRKSEILNKSITAANGDYLVFLDGDCVPRTSYISDHRKLARKNRIVGCSRILLDQTITQHIIDNKLQPSKWSLFEFLKLRISGHANRILPLIRFPLNAFRNQTPKRWQKIRGCNFGIYRKEIIKIGGFDESFTGWGYEDSDLAVRAINSGSLVKRGDYLATVLHLWHSEMPRDEASSNKEKLNSTISSNRTTSISSPFLDPQG